MIHSISSELFLRENGHQRDLDTRLGKRKMHESSSPSEMPLTAVKYRYIESKLAAYIDAG